MSQLGMIPKDEETNETTQSYNSVQGMLQTRMYKPIQELAIGNQMTLKIRLPADLYFKRISLCK